MISYSNQMMAKNLGIDSVCSLDVTFASRVPGNFQLFSGAGQSGWFVGRGVYPWIGQFWQSPKLIYITFVKISRKVYSLFISQLDRPKIIRLRSKNLASPCWYFFCGQ